MLKEGIVKVGVSYNNDCSFKKVYIVQSLAPELDSSALKGVSKIQKLRLKYSLTKDCSTRKDTTYVIHFKLYK